MSWESEQFNALTHHLARIERRLDALIEAILGADADKLAALTAQLKTDDDALAAAVKANQPPD